MKARALLGSIVASMSVLVLAWQLGVQPASSTTGSNTTSTSTAASSGSNDASPTVESPTSAADSSTVSYTGTTVGHEYGTVTVSIMVTDGTLTDTTAELTTTHDRSEKINARAVPVLRSEVLTAQSAEVSMISGATYTSEAYLASLQSALDQAGL